MPTQLTDFQSGLIDDVLTSFVEVVIRFSGSGLRKRVMASGLLDGLVSGTLSEAEFLQKLDKITNTVDHAFDVTHGSLFGQEVQAPFRKTMLRLYKLLNDRTARYQLIHGALGEYTDELDEAILARVREPWADRFTANFPAINDALRAAFEEDIAHWEADATPDETWRQNPDAIELLPTHNALRSLWSKLKEQSEEQQASSHSTKNRQVQAMLAAYRAQQEENFSIDCTGMTIDALRGQQIGLVEAINLTLAEACTTLIFDFQVQADNFQVTDVLTGDCEMSFHLSSSDTVGFAVQQLARVHCLSDDELNKQLKALPTLITMQSSRSPEVPVAMRVLVRQTQAKVSQYFASLLETKKAIEAWIGDDKAREKFFYEGLVRQVGADHFQKLVAQCVSDVQALCKEQLSPEEEAAYKTFYIEALRDVLGHEDTAAGQLNAGLLLLSSEHNKLERLISRNNQMYMYVRYISGRYGMNLDPDDFEFDRARTSYFPWSAHYRPDASSEMTFESMRALIGDTTALSPAESKDDAAAGEDAKPAEEHADAGEAASKLSVLRRLARLKVAQAFGEYTNTCLPSLMVNELEHSQSTSSASETDADNMRPEVTIAFMSNPQLIFKIPSVAPLVLGRPTTGIELGLDAFPDLFELEEKSRDDQIESIEARYYLDVMRVLKVSLDDAHEDTLSQRQLRNERPEERLDSLQMMRDRKLARHTQTQTQRPPQGAGAPSVRGQSVFDQQRPAGRPAPAPDGDPGSTRDGVPGPDEDSCTIM